MPKLSVIVPVYNVEKYLDRCVTSIRNQIFSDWEMILVDDGSQDNSYELCDAFAKNDSRIKVVHKENGGLSSARNAGLKIAEGDYVGFIDSDDTIQEDMYSRMIEIIEKTSADFVMTDCVRITVRDTVFLKTQKIREGFYGKDAIRKEIFPSLIMGSDIEYGPLLSVCLCIYNRDFLLRNNLWFAEDIRWSEDNLFSAKIGYCADSFYYLKGEGLYNYYQNEGTITTSYRKGAWQIYSKMNDYLHNYFTEAPDYDFGQELKWHMIYYACVCLSQTKSLSKEKAKQEIVKILNSNQLKEAFKGVDLSNVNTKLKVQLYLMKHKHVSALHYLIKRR